MTAFFIHNGYTLNNNYYLYFAILNSIVMKNKTKNTYPKGFLKKYRKGRSDEVLFLELKKGFLKLEYGLYENPGLLSLVSYVHSQRKDAMAIGNRLEICLDEDDTSAQVTFIAEMGVSGTQWSNGEVIWGHTYDDDSPPSPGRKISLDDWIDECINIMISK